MTERGREKEKESDKRTNTSKERRVELHDRGTRETEEGERGKECVPPNHTLHK